MHLTERDLYQGYGVRLRPSLGAERIARAHATEAALLERIRELWTFRAWYARQPRQDYWWDLATRNTVELRALVQVARKARRAVDATPDPMDLAKADHSMRWHEDLDR